MLQKMILHMTAKEVLKQLALLGDERAGTGNHLAQLLVHGVLILAASHPIELTELLDKLVHCKHGGGEGLTLVVDVFGAFDYFVVQDLIRVDEIGHFTAKNSTIRDHLSGHTALHRPHILHIPYILLLLSRFRRLSELFGIVILQPFTEVLIRLDFFTPAKGLQESRKVFLSSSYRLFGLLLLLNG